MTDHALDRPLAVAGALSRLAPDELAVIRETVAKGATDAELAMFLELAARYELDPFAREIWCVRLGGERGPMTIMVGRDGFLAIGNRHPAFDGLESDAVREGDTFRRTPAGIEHAYGSKRGELIGAYALAWRKDRRLPGYFFAAFTEYSRSSNPAWKNYPSAMIVKVAEVNALKRAFSVSGIVSEEELGPVMAPLTRPAPVIESDDAPPPWRARWAVLRAMAATGGVETQELMGLLRDAGVPNAASLADDEVWAQAQALVEERLGPHPGEDDEGELGDAEPLFPDESRADPDAA